MSAWAQGWPRRRSGKTGAGPGGAMALPGLGSKHFLGAMAPPGLGPEFVAGAMAPLGPGPKV